MKVVPGKDSLVRVVEVLVNRKAKVHPITEIVPLPSTVCWSAEGGGNC